MRRSGFRGASFMCAPNGAPGGQSIVPPLSAAGALAPSVLLRALTPRKGGGGLPALSSSTVRGASRIVPIPSGCLASTRPLQDAETTNGEVPAQCRYLPVEFGGPPDGDPPTRCPAYCSEPPKLFMNGSEQSARPSALMPQAMMRWPAAGSVCSTVSEPGTLARSADVIT